LISKLDIGSLDYYIIVRIKINLNWITL
jgi:hypothetical protein